MPRYKDRRLSLMDLVPRFESEPSSTHVRNAIGAIQRLEHDGIEFWDEDSDQLSRWREGVAVLSALLNQLGELRYGRKLDLATAQREFIQEFEHTTERMIQMIHSTSKHPNSDRRIDEITLWFGMIFRLSTYALVSYWIDDKTEELSVKITHDLTTGETTDEWSRNEMKVPRMYRRSTNKI